MCQIKAVVIFLVLGLFVSACDNNRQSGQTISEGIELQAQAIRMADMQVAWVLEANRKDQHIVVAKEHGRVLPQMLYDDFYALDYFFYPILASLDSSKRMIYLKTGISEGKTADFIRILSSGSGINKGIANSAAEHLGRYNKNYWRDLAEKMNLSHEVNPILHSLDSLISNAIWKSKRITEAGPFLVFLSKLELDLLEIKQIIYEELNGVFNSMDNWPSPQVTVEPALVKKGEIVMVSAFILPPELITRMPFYVEMANGRKVYAERNISISLMTYKKGLNIVRGAMEAKNKVTGEMIKYPFQAKYYVTE